MQRTIDRRLVAFTGSLASDVDLTRVVAIQRPAGVERERVDDVFFHMATHAIHHRGQVHAMLAGTSVVPPLRVPAPRDMSSPKSNPLASTRTGPEASKCSARHKDSNL